MSDMFDNLPFRPAGILLPQNCDLSLWAVVACDQYTSQPEYWQRVEERVGRNPSALRLILPESCLEGPGAETDVMEVNNTMTRYLREGQFRALPNTMVYVERTLSSGRVRQGLVGMVDLEEYDYEPGASTAVRATEGTVLSRIPPRVAVRKNAPIELPHAMLLADDPECTVIEPLAEQRGEMEPLYDFELMENGGHVRGWRLNEAQLERVSRALGALKERAGRERDGFLFAVGDGNHSLAAAKEHYERRKGLTRPEQWPGLPSRFALTELVNLHNPGVDFQPIHRVVFGAEPEEVLDVLCRCFPKTRRNSEPLPGEHLLYYSYGSVQGTAAVPCPDSLLPVGTLQGFLDDYLKFNPRLRVDYIHGTDVAQRLAQRPGTIAFLLPALDKEDLFPAVLRHGVLPRKTFSMGEAQDKRFYLEARKIRA